MPIYSRYPGKPPLGTPIDWSRPLAKGLAAFWPFNEGSWLPYDAVSGLQMTLESGTLAWGASRGGAAITSVLGSGPVYKLRHATISTSSDLTAIVWVSFASFQASSPFISGLFWNADSTFGFRLGDSSIPDNSLQVVLGSSDRKAASSNLLATGTPYAIAMTLGPSVGDTHTVTQTGWVNGVNWCSQSVDKAPVTSGNSYIFRDDQSGSRTPDASLWAVGIWSRCLSQDELLRACVPPAEVFGLLYGSRRSYSLYKRTAVASPVVARRGFGGERAGSRGVA